VGQEEVGGLEGLQRAELVFVEDDPVPGKHGDPGLALESFDPTCEELYARGIGGLVGHDLTHFGKGATITSLGPCSTSIGDSVVRCVWGMGSAS
jgi:hypothetical protein